MTQTTRKRQALNTKADSSEARNELLRALDLIQQAGGIFTLLRFIDEGNLLTPPEQKLEAVLKALNSVGELGESLIEEIFICIAEAERALPLLQQSEAA